MVHLPSLPFTLSGIFPDALSDETQRQESPFIGSNTREWAYYGNWVLLEQRWQEFSSKLGKEKY